MTPLDAAAAARPRPPARSRRRTRARLATHERALVLHRRSARVLVFAIGTNFLTLGNAVEILRASAEVGLLALALTPVILTGGIDLSVGSLMGLSAVVFGAIWRDAGLPIPVAARPRSASALRAARERAARRAAPACRR